MDSESPPNLFLTLYCFDVLNHSVPTKAYFSYIQLTSPWNDSIQQEVLKYTLKAV